MTTQITYYKGILRCQFSTQRSKELGQEHRTIFQHIALEPTFELFAMETISEEVYTSELIRFQAGPHLRHQESEAIDYYHQDLAPDGKRMLVADMLMGVDVEPKVIDSKTWEWNELQFDSVPQKYLHDCFLAYHPNSNHGRISGPVVLKRIQELDEKGNEIFKVSETAETEKQVLQRQGCFQESRGCVRRIYGFNLGLKNWFNSIFGGIFGRNLIGTEPNGCLPTLFPSGCSGPGCQRFGCGIFGLLAALALLLWLLKSLLFSDTLKSNTKERIVERIVHDTIYVEKNSQVDTVTYIDETTNTTVKMLSLPNVQFEKNRAILLRSSIPQINELAAYLIQNPEISAEIFGHTDSDGNAEANRMLSQSRAEEVRSYLLKNGVEASRVKATGKGESEPVTNNSTAEGRAMNRRVEVKLSQSSATKTTRTKEDRRQE